MILRAQVVKGDSCQGQVVRDELSGTSCEGASCQEASR